MQTPIPNSHSLSTQWLLRIFLLCLCLPFFTSCTSTRTIVNSLDEREANEIIVYLAGKGIQATKVQSKETGAGGGSKIVFWDIQVNEEQSIEAMSILNQAGLPRRRGQNLLNIFAGGGLVPSELQEKIRYQAGLAEQIASVIRKIDGILDAEVQISFPEEDPLNPGKTKGKITASVYVKHTGVLDDPNTQLIPKIKRLVAASVPGLDYDNVTVIGDRARYNAPTSTGITEGLAEEEKSYVNVWSIIIAKESLTRFRILFFSLVVAILLLALALIWLGWKLYPILKKHGGLRELFHVHPIPIEPKMDETKATEKVEESAKKSEEEGKVDQEIDET